MLPLLHQFQLILLLLRELGDCQIGIASLSMLAEDTPPDPVDAPDQSPELPQFDDAVEMSS